MSEDREDILKQTRDRAERLLGELLRRQADLELNQRAIRSSEQLAALRLALADAIASARRMIGTIDEALKSSDGKHGNST